MAKVNLLIKAVLLVAMIIAVVFLFNKGINYYLDWQQDVKKAQVAAEKAKKQAFAVKLVYVIDRNRYFTMFAIEGDCKRGGEFWYHDITRGIHSRVGQGKTSYDYFFTDGEQHLGFPTARRDLQASAPFYYSNDFGQTWEPRTFDGNNTVNIFTQGKRVSAREKELDKDRQMAGVRTPSGWNKMMCLDVSMMVADKQGQRVYDDRKIEKLLYKIDNERYFSYLSDGQTCTTNGEIFYNDKHKGIKSKLGYIEADKWGFSPLSMILSNDKYLALPNNKLNKGFIYLSDDFGKSWEYSRAIGMDAIYSIFTINDFGVFILSDFHSAMAATSNRSREENRYEYVNGRTLLPIAQYSPIAEPFKMKNIELVMDVDTKEIFQIINRGNPNLKKIEKLTELSIDKIRHSQTPSGWTETQCKPLSALKEQN
ncbi:T6SS immunity protein Tli3 family protein [Pragia fontium]|uniref:T6SS immunity protein Tli3 family protein n=1 Tax=Pragia fontium TaxID=82985 RepID=UPI000F6BE940|nr:hypothetical protein [Pragia fontium]VEJ54169.1 Uncharacterised protein [Pragia fontium]